MLTTIVPPPPRREGRVLPWRRYHVYELPWNKRQEIVTTLRLVEKGNR